MQTVVSSSLTLFFKFFIPVFWMVFFGAFTVACWFNDSVTVGQLSNKSFRLGLTLFFLFGTILLYWSLMRLKRVEMDSQFMYVTNYFKTYRYPYINIEKIEEKDYLFFRTIIISLKIPGHFGKKIAFVASRKRFNQFIGNHPEVLKQFLDIEEIR